MKKIVIVPILLALAIALPAQDGKFFASIGASAFAPADARFKELYGDMQASPELKLGYNLYRHFYFWLGGSFVSATGTIPVLEAEAKASQMFLSFGAGWETRRRGRLQADLCAALLMAGLREEAMDATVSKWAPGFDVRAGLRYFLKKKIFLGLTLGYASASAEIDAKDVVIGGVRIGGSLGLRF
ncbi:MAG: hypothetical protein MUC72_06935 [Acidobacteria bacterium]|jgi:hypothetical protein|nr:hypothetical protein [Acidobacteriota bacterium]